MSNFTVSCPVSIGKLVLVEIDKQPFLFFPEDSWFLSKVEVKSPEGDIYNFPIHRWITDGKVYSFREGTGLENSKTKYIYNGCGINLCLTLFVFHPLSPESL